MPDKDLNIKIVTTKEGVGAQQAKAEIDGLKTAADTTGESATNLRYKVLGFRMILEGFNATARGGINIFHGLTSAVSGLVFVLSNTVWGRLAQIAGIIISLGASLYALFRPAQTAIEDTGTAVEKVADKLKKDDWAATIEKATAGAKEFAAELDKAAQAAETTRKQLDEIGDAELASKLANIDLEVAQGGMSKEQGQLARIDTRQSFEQQKNDREKQALEDRIAANEKERADLSVELQVARQAAEKAKNEYAQKMGWGEGEGEFALSASDDYKAKLAAATSPEQQTKILEENALRKRAEAAEANKSATGTFQIEADAKLRTDIQKDQSRLTALGFQSKALETGSIAQRLTVSREISSQKDAEESRQAADRAAYNEKVQAEQEKRREALARDAKSQAGDRATQILDLQRAEEESAQSQLRAAEKAVGAKGLSSRERAQAKQGLSLAQSRFSQEQSDVVQASALQGKIRTAVDPADIAKLLNALESIGNAFKTVANAADNQASQIKNGGLRTK